MTGTEQFRFLTPAQDNQQSPQEELLGYFQWTREAFKDFPYSIVIWMTSYLQQPLEHKSPDFWSWRKGVFRFQRHPTNLVDLTNLKPHLESFIPEINQQVLSLLPLEDLQELIAKVERDKGKKTAQLASLYRDLGQVYLGRSKDGKSVNYQSEQNLGIEYLQKAIELQQEFNLDNDLATTLNNLAVLHESQGRYEEAEPLCLQALELSGKLLGEEHPDLAVSLNNLAGLYESQGRHEEAEPLYLQAVALIMKLFGEEHPNAKKIFNNFVYFIQQVRQEDRVSKLSDHPLTRSLLKKLQSS